MTFFDSLKTVIFPGINDVPREATNLKAGNGSSLVAKLNILADKLNAHVPLKKSALTETWNNSKQFYLDTVNGNDDNSGETTNLKKKTLTSLINLIKTKKLASFTRVYVTGVITETIDLTSLWSDVIEKGLYGGAKIAFYGAHNFTIQHNKQIVENNPNTNLSVVFNGINFISTTAPLQIANQSNNIFFDYCWFDTQGNTNYTLLNIKNSRIVNFYGENNRSFGNVAGQYVTALNCEDNSMVYLDNIVFNNFEQAISLDDYSQVFNLGVQNKFELVNIPVGIGWASTFLTSYPEAYMSSLNTFAAGKFNPIIQERFVLNQATNQIITLFKNYTVSKKLYTLEVNSLPANTTLEVYLDGQATSVIVDELNTYTVNQASIFQQVSLGATIAVNIVGSIPDNTIISIGLIESY